MPAPNQSQPFQRVGTGGPPTADQIRDIYDKLEIVLSQLTAAQAQVTALTARVTALETP